MAAKEFSTAKRRNKPIEFMLDDDEYHFTPPKVAGMLLDTIDAEDSGMNPDTAEVRSMLDWLSDGLPEDENAKLVERLRDPEDDFDFTTLAEVVVWLIQETMGRPTKPRSGSSRRPAKSG